MPVFPGSFWPIWVPLPPYCPRTTRCQPPTEKWDVSAKPAASSEATTGSSCYTAVVSEKPIDEVAKELLPFRFAPSPEHGVPYASVVVLLSVDDWARIKRGDLKLPADWGTPATLKKIA